MALEDEGAQPQGQVLSTCSEDCSEQPADGLLIIHVWLASHTWMIHQQVVVECLWGCQRSIIGGRAECCTAVTVTVACLPALMWLVAADAAHLSSCMVCTMWVVQCTVPVGPSELCGRPTDGTHAQLVQHFSAVTCLLPATSMHVWSAPFELLYSTSGVVTAPG